MANESISAKLSEQKDDEAVAVNYDFGDSLEDAVERFGEEVVYSRFKAAAVVDLQALIRRGIKAKKDAKQIQADADEWKPGVKRVSRKSSEDRIKESFSKMSAEDRAALLAQLQADLEDE